MHAPRTVTTLMVSMAAAGALLLAGCGSGTTASAPTAATSASAAAAVPEASTAAPAPSAPISSATAEVPAGPVVATWTCARDGEKVTCTCEGSEADCKSTVAKPSKIKGRNSGSVVFFSEEKGYGFIAGAGSAEQVFVHVSGIRDDIRGGDCVEFDVEEGKKGFNAVNVQLC